MSPLGSVLFLMSLGFTGLLFGLRSYTGGVLYPPGGPCLSEVSPVGYYYGLKNEKGRHSYRPQPMGSHCMDERFRRVRIWLLAARPKTLPAAIAPVLLGTALAWGESVFHASSACAALIAAVLIQVAANYANDYYDYLKGADAGERLGPQRATQAGLVTPAQMRNATALVLALAALFGLYLIYRGGWPILLIGLLSMLFAVLYTGGPFPLGYIGVADLFVLVFFGPVAVAGTYYVQALYMPWPPILVGFAPGLLSVAILTVNNLRDVDQDRQAGKKTLAVRFGVGYARVQYLVCMVVALAVIPLGATLLTGRVLSCLALFALIPASGCVKIVFTKREGAILNQTLAGTGKVLLLFSVLFSLGWIIS